MGQNGLAAKIFNDSAKVQDLGYTYDPASNITRIEDAALKTVFNANQQVDSSCDYTYDPLYRLIQATGREHVGQSAFAFAPADGNYHDYPFLAPSQQKRSAGAAQLHRGVCLRLRSAISRRWFIRR